MKRTIILAAAVLVCSCSFITINGEALKDVAGSGSGKIVVNASGNLETKEFTVEDFDAIKVSGSYNIVYVPGAQSVQVSAPDNVMPYLTVKVEDNTLILSQSGKARIRNARNITAYVSAETLTRVGISGSGNFKAHEGLAAKDIKFNVSGAGNLDVDGLKAENVDVKVSGAGNIDFDNLDCIRIYTRISGAGNTDISGKAENADLEVSGAGNINVKGLECENLETNISGTGKVKR